MSDVELLEHAVAFHSDSPASGTTPRPVDPTWKPASLLDRILVATDGSRAAGAALRIVRELVARKRGQVGQVEVVTVLTRPEPAGAPALLVDTAEIGPLPSFGRTALARIRRQIRAAGLPGWPLHVGFGSPARAICRTATETGATMIVIGIGRHTTAGRMFGADTARRVASNADVAVLAVNEGATTLGHSAVAAVDFSAASGRAARAALSLLDPPATLQLVHVRPRFETAPAETEGYQNIYMSGIEAALDELYSGLPKIEGVSVGSFAIAGQPDAAILDFAHRLAAGFIAVGRHGHNLGERLLIGSTTNALLDGAGCPVLITPPVPRLKPRR